jgi:hypothetical protein
LPGARRASDSPIFHDSRRTSHGTHSGNATSWAT